MVFNATFNNISIITWRKEWNLVISIFDATCCMLIQYTIWLFPHSWLVTCFLTSVIRMGATSGAITYNLSGEVVFTPPPLFRGVCVAQSLAFSVMFCRSLCVFFHGHVVTVIIWAHFVILYIGCAVGHNFEGGKHKEHPTQISLIWFNVFKGEDLKCESLQRTMDNTETKWWQKLK